MDSQGIEDVAGRGAARGWHCAEMFNDEGSDPWLLVCLLPATVVWLMFFLVWLQQALAGDLFA